MIEGGTSPLAPGADVPAGTRVSGDQDDLDVLLDEFAPGADDALRAALKGDLALARALRRIEEIRRIQDAITGARAVLARPAPARKSGNWWGGTEAENPAYTAWKAANAEAAKTLSKYYSDDGLGTYEKPTPALTALQTEVRQLDASARSRATALQNKQAEAPTATNPPDLVWLPTGDGNEQAHVYDPGTRKYVPATDAAGQPIPTRKASQPSQPAPRVSKGTQSWELKELDGEWWQVPTIAREDGSWEPDYQSGRMPQRAAGMPTGRPDLQILDGVPYVMGPDGKTLQPVPGYVKPPLFRTDDRGRGYTSTDNGATWKPATGLPGTPQTISVDGVVYPLDENGLPLVDRGVRVPQGVEPQTIDGYLVQVDPTTNAISRTDLYTPEQRARFEETQGITVETARTNLQTAQQNLERARQLQDPAAEYQRQVQLSQQEATKYRDDLNQQVLEGRLSVEDAGTQFDTWWDTNVEAKLAPYRMVAETGYRKEQNEYLQRQAAEEARVEAVNRAREQLGYQAGETARNELNALAPSARSPEFLQQLAQNVSNIGKPLPGGVTQHHGGMQFSPESLSLENVRRAMPNLTEVGQNAAARALSQISPAAARQVGMAPPPVPSLPDFQGFMQQAPFQIPNPALPVPGQAALDLGNPANAARLGLPVQPGFAGTRYQGGRVEPWQIPA